MKILFYCQNLLGIGHLTRSLAICRGLVKEFEVHFVQGGPDIGKTLDYKNFHQHLLDPLLMEESDSSLYDPLRKREVKEIFAAREKQLEKICEQAFDHVIIELYPFGRRKFRKEILYLLDQVKKSNPKIKVSCSLRDILVENKGSEKRNDEVIQIVKDNFDKVLVHSDPAVFKLEDTFPRIEKIEEKIVYTGFVAEEEMAQSQTKPIRKKQILVSLGGGSVGIELIEATLNVAHFFPEITFLMVPGPFSPAETVARLQEKKVANVIWKKFLQDFEKELAQSCLSISLAGYNTVMNLLNTKTFGIVLPYRANQEQEMRAKKLAESGVLLVLEEDALSEKQMKNTIDLALGKKYPELKINLDGANTTRELLRKNFND